MLVLITFHWNLVRLAYLEAVLITVTSYPTTVTVVVITNQPTELAHVAADRSWDNRVSILQELPPLRHPYMLAHVHRSVVRDRTQTGEFNGHQKLLNYACASESFQWTVRVRNDVSVAVVSNGS